MPTKEVAVHSAKVGTTGPDTLETSYDTTSIYYEATDTLEVTYHIYDTLYGNDGDDDLRVVLHSHPLTGEQLTPELHGDWGNDTLRGGGSDDKLEGGEDDDTIYGGAGNDTINGNFDALVPHNQVGDDIIYGEGGNDVIDAGQGNDLVYGGDGDDLITIRGFASGTDATAATVVVDGGDGTDTLRLQNRLNLTVSNVEIAEIALLQIEHGVLDSIGAIRSWSSQDPVIYFVDAGQSILRPDTGVMGYIGGFSGNDDITFATGDSHWGVDLGGGDDRLVAAAGNDILNGDIGNDTIYGGAGADSINGDFGSIAGNDRLYGEAGNDTIDAGEGNDFVDGGTGDDVITVRGFSSGATATVVVDGGDGTDTLRLTNDAAPFGININLTWTNIEIAEIGILQIAHGSLDGFGMLRAARDGWATIVFTNAGQSQLRADTGVAGHVSGSSGDDDIIFITGDTGWVISLHGGNDRAIGTTGNDTLYGGTGEDTLDGGAGNDTLTGGSDNDTFIYDGQGADIITDFAGGAGIADAIKVTSTYATFAEIQAHTTLVNGGADTQIDFGGGNTLTLVDFNGALHVNDFSFPTLPPAITSNGGGDAASISIAEGTTAVTTVAANDPEATAITYSLAGGADQSLFEIDVNTGALRFIAAPDFEAPNDAGANNTYEVVVRATDAENESDTQTITVTVTDVLEAPEIAVAGNGAAIIDGDSSPDTADHTDFGSVAQGASVIRTFTVTNTGNTALSASGLSVPAGFEVVEGLSAVIASGASDTFQVRMNTASAGTKSGQITFTTNDADESPFNFSISGVVTAPPPPTGPEVAVSGNGLIIADGDTMPDAADGTAFGVHLVGEVVTHTFTVTNIGTADLKTSGLKLPNGFKLGTDKLLATIAPGASDTFTVLLDTSKVGSFAGVLSFTTNDPDEKAFNFNLSAEVTAPEIAVTGNARNIADNDKSPALTDHTDFGTSAYGEAGAIRTFSITNSGNAALTISSVTAPAGFALLGGIPTSVAAGATETFQVQLLTNAGTGLQQGDVVILTDDSNEAIFNFRIKGNVTAEKFPGSPDADTFIAKAHAEAFSGDAGADTVSYAAATALVVANLASPNGNKGFAAGDSYNSIENLTGSGFNDTLTGDTFDNVLDGGTGADKLNGGAGFDTASYAKATAGVTANLLNAKLNTGDAAGDTYTAIENMTGSAFDDTLVGNTGVNVIAGGDGDDILIGNAGIDTLTGGLGLDTFLFSAIKDGGGATAATTKATGDIAVDFVSGTDHIGILRSGFKLASTLLEADFIADGYFLPGPGDVPVSTANATGVAATATGHGQFLFNEATDQLWWDADGTGKAKAVLLATFQNGAHVTPGDFDLL